MEKYNGDKNPYLDGDCAEVLGCESVVWKTSDVEFPMLERRSSGALSDKMEKEKLQSKTYPPLLSTLSYVNGRPLFSLEKVTGKDGQLSMYLVVNEKKDILRCFRDDGRLTMWFASDDDDDDDDDGNFDDYVFVDCNIQSEN